MAILNLQFEKTHAAIKHTFDIFSKHHAGILGYPDFLVTKEILIKCLGEEYVSSLNPSIFEESIKKSHNVNHDIIYNYIDILDQAYNINSTVFDVAQHRGIETLLNLNEPIPTQYHRLFNLVLDSSVLEHCFNISQAFKNMCDMVCLNGIVSTVAPLYNLNHGYYNVNPIMYIDGFEQNGFKILYQGFMDQRGTEVLEMTRKSSPNKIYNLIIAKRISDNQFQWPIQTHKGQFIENIL